MSFGASADNRNLGQYLSELNKKVRQLTDKICCLVDAINNGNGEGTVPNIQTTSAGTNSNVPAGFRSISIARTSSNGGNVTITLSDGSTYLLGIQYEVFVDAASVGDVLPAYAIVGAGETWKWHGIK